MSVMRNIPIARKFTFAFGLVCTLCVGLGTYTFLTFRDITAKTTQVSEDSLPSMVLIADMRTALDTLRIQDLELLLCQTPVCMSQHSALRQKAVEAFQTNDQAYASHVNAGEEHDL